MQALVEMYVKKKKWILAKDGKRGSPRHTPLAIRETVQQPYWETKGEFRLFRNGTQQVFKRSKKHDQKAVSV